MSPPITPFLWFNDQLEDALEFYAGIFADMSVHSRQQMTGPDGVSRLFSAEFSLNGQRFMALNGGPHYSFTPAVSFFISCDTQEDVDHYWDRLLAGGEAQRCGWLRDRYGLSWQVVPRALPALLHDADRGRAGRAMAAMMQMVKLDIAALHKAADGG